MTTLKRRRMIAKRVRDRTLVSMACAYQRHIRNIKRRELQEQAARARLFGRVH